jgi:hypothetical protein
MAVDPQITRPRAVSPLAVLPEVRTKIAEDIAKPNTGDLPFRESETTSRKSTETLYERRAIRSHPTRNLEMQETERKKAFSRQNPLRY